MSISANETKVVQVIAPAAIADGVAWTTVEVDTQDWEYATFFFMLGASDIAVATLALQESDTSGSGMANVAGCVYGTSSNTAGITSTLPSSVDDNKVFSIEVDLKARKRFLDLSAVPGNGVLGTFAAAWCELSRGHATPVTAAQRGLSQSLRV